MPQVLNIYDGGLQAIQGHTVGVIIFKLVTGEGKPELMIGYCQPNYRDAIIKSLKRIHWNQNADIHPESLEKDNAQK